MTGPDADGILHTHGAHHGSWARDDGAPLLTLPSLAAGLPGRDGTASRPEALGMLTLDDLIRAASGELDRAGWQRAVTAGHSPGGAVAAGLAAPARGGRLTWSSSPPACPDRTAARWTAGRPPPPAASAPLSSRSAAGTTPCSLTLPPWSHHQPRRPHPGCGSGRLHRGPARSRPTGPIPARSPKGP